MQISETPEAASPGGPDNLSESDIPIDLTSDNENDFLERNIDTDEATSMRVDQEFPPDQLVAPQQLPSDVRWPPRSGTVTPPARDASKTPLNRSPSKAIAAVQGQPRSPPASFKTAQSSISDSMASIPSIPTTNTGTATPAISQPQIISASALSAALDTAIAP